MDYLEVKQQVVMEVKDSLISLLKQIEPEVITAITQTVKNDYEQKLHAQELEITDLKNRIKDLEESVAWVAHKFNIEL